MIDYFRRLLAFRRSTLRAPGPAGRTLRIMKILSVLVWTLLFACSQRAGAQTAPGQPTPSFTVPALPSAVATPGGAAVSTPTQSAVATPTGGAAPSITVPAVPTVSAPAAPGSAASTGSGSKPATIGIDLGDQANKPSNSVMIIVGLTLLSLAPSLLIMMTSFTRMVIVLGLTRNAIGLQAVPPNQVVVGLALFLSLFVMAPTLSKMNEQGLQPLLKGQISQSEAVTKASEPLKQFMLANTRRAELSMMISASKQQRPATAEKVSMTTLIPAFVLSELKTAFIIGFVIFIPFLVIDLVVSAVLMALGMMMLPPAFVALPFKLLLFVMVDGWSLVAKTLVESFR